MANQRQIRNLDELMDGGLTERFNAELRRVLENVFDPNTDHKKKRTITIGISIVPNEKRDAAEFKVEVKSTIAPPAPSAQTGFLSRDEQTGAVTATEMTNQTPGQMKMDGTSVIPKVIDFGN